jgi:hypothetical protein
MGTLSWAARRGVDAVAVGVAAWESVRSGQVTTPLDAF